MIVNKYANGNGGGGGTGSTITVDAALSSSSTNPVENRVITNALSEYTTNEYVESRFDAAEAYTDSQVNNLEEALSEAITAATENMATQDYVDTAINEELQGYATEAYVDNAITAATEDLASTQYVDDAIAAIPAPDMTNYYTKSEVDAEITGATDDMATKTWVGQQGYLTQHQDISGKLDKTDFNTYTGATETALAEKLDASAYTIDNVIDSASTNPVENRVVANALDNKAEKANVDTNTDSRYFPLWNSDGVVIGKYGNIVYRVSFGINGWTYNIYRDKKNEALPSIYAPISPGTKGQILVSTGNKIPEWSDNNFVTSGDVATQIGTAIESETARTESTYAKPSQIPSLAGYATETYVDNAMASETARTESTYLKEHQDISGKLDKTDFNTYTGATETALAEKLDASAYTVDNAIDSASTNPVENNVIYDALNGVSSTTQMEIIESATTSVCLSASTIGNIYFKETNLPDYLAINLGEYITGYTIFYEINDGTTNKFDTDTYDGSSIALEKIGVRCPLYGESNISISSSNLDGTYNYYMVYNQVKKYVVIYKNLPVIAEVSDHAANISDVPAAQDGSDTKYYVYAGTGNKKVLTNVWLTTTVQHDSTFRRLNIEYNSTVWGDLEKNTSTFIIPGGNANQPGVKTYRDSVVIDNAMGALNGLTETKTLTIGNQTSNYIEGLSYTKYYLCETDDPRYLVYHSVGNEVILSEYVYLNGIAYYYLNVYGGSSEDRIITPDEVYPSAFTGCIMQLGEYSPGSNNSLHVSCPANSDTYFIVDKELHTIQVTDSLTFTRAKNIKETIDNNCVQSTDVRTMVKCTQAQYDAMATHDQNTFYIITNS